MALLICCALDRLALDRRRLAAWESAWALTGPDGQPVADAHSS